MKHLTPLAIGAALAAAAAHSFAAPVANCPIAQAIAPGGNGAFAARFGAGTAAFRTTAANIREGFRRACARKLLAGSTLLNVRGVERRRIALENWPDANGPAIEGDQRRDRSWRLILAHPFVASDGTVNIPKAAEVEEAIFCAVRKPTRKQVEESGRCLPD